jgi:predicted metalloprotease with PDZ domain
VFTRNINPHCTLIQNHFWKNSRRLVLAALDSVAGRSMAQPLADWVHGTGELPLKALLAQAGVDWGEEASDLAAELGLRLAEGPVTGVQVRTVHRGSMAERAGIAAGDELLAVDGWRVRRLDEARAWLTPGQAFDLLLVRDQRVLTRRLSPAAGAPRQAGLQLAAAPAPAARALRRGWIGV